MWEVSWCPLGQLFHSPTALGVTWHKIYGHRCRKVSQRITTIHPSILHCLSFNPKKEVIITMQIQLHIVQPSTCRFSPLKQVIIPQHQVVRCRTPNRNDMPGAIERLPWQYSHVEDEGITKNCSAINSRNFLNNPAADFRSFYGEKSLLWGHIVT